MKVLQVLCGKTWGGGSVVVLAITRALIERGDQVWVLSFEEENDRRFRDVGAKLVRPPFWSDSLSPLDGLVGLSLWNVCRKERFDLVATHTSKGGFIGRIAARCAGVPHIVHHAHGFSFNRVLSPRSFRFCVALERFAARFGDYTISVNDQHRQQAIALKVSTPESICTVHNGIDISPFSAGSGAELRRELGIGDDVPLIGAVGRMAPQKGFTYLIQAMPHVLAKIPNARLILAGGGPLRNELESEAAARGVSGKIDFLDFRRDVPDLLAAFDCFVQPSLWEGLSISLIEALAAGRPLVATDIDGNREVVRHEETGLLVPPADVEALADGISRILLDRNLSARLAENARSAAHSQFSEQRMVQQNLAVYDRIVGLPTSSPVYGPA
jgi:glycosyltransferase involved in cell wall biosynthesis